jgi:hypothetical protein
MSSSPMGALSWVVNIVVVWQKRCNGNRLVNNISFVVLGNETIYPSFSTYNDAAQCRLGVHSHRIG